MLTKKNLFDRIINGGQSLIVLVCYAAVAQSVERRIGSAEVTGPIPVSSLLKPQSLSGVFLVVRPAGARSNGCKSRIRPVVGRI